jgi:hypothetical protein
VKKSGRLSTKECEFIRANRDTMPLEEIALHLGRGVETVRGYIGLGAAPGKSPDVDDGEDWEVIRKTFSADEQKFFRRKYADFSNQFDNDVLPTEDAQLIQAITLWVLMNRTMVKQKQLEDDIDRVSKYRRKLEEDHKGGSEWAPEDRDRLELYRTDVRGWKAEIDSLAKQFTQYSNERNNILKTLRANRADRIKEIESGTETFVGLVKKVSKKEGQKEEGRRMELLALAYERERLRLMEPRLYPDGNEDHPLLSAETLELYDAPPAGREDVPAGRATQDEANGPDGTPAQERNEDGDEGRVD